MLVLLTEIILPILEAKITITYHQRISLVKAIFKIFSDPKFDTGRLLVELYLNYDCDINGASNDNVWERLVGSLCKIMTQHVISASRSRGSTRDLAQIPEAEAESNQPAEVFLPEITTEKLGLASRDQVRDFLAATGDVPEMKRKSLELIVNGILISLIRWITLKSKPEEKKIEGSEDHDSQKLDLKIEDYNEPEILNPADPAAFEILKHRKQIIADGIKLFNVNAKKGMRFLLQAESGLPRTTEAIAKFLFETHTLNKAMIGEFLGEGDEDNIKIMHAFVDLMQFKDSAFVDALRTFLQSFRLPGEAQKIDRFMLKFADRYVKDNPESFESAGNFLSCLSERYCICFSLFSHYA
jgi:brefeldin A-inhibited guanine nucleotide-exchange protein